MTRRLRITAHGAIVALVLAWTSRPVRRPRGARLATGASSGFWRGSDCHHREVFLLRRVWIDPRSTIETAARQVSWQDFVYGGKSVLDFCRLPDSARPRMAPQATRHHTKSRSQPVLIVDLTFTRKRRSDVGGGLSLRLGNAWPNSRIVDIWSRREPARSQLRAQHEKPTAWWRRTVPGRAFAHANRFCCVRRARTLHMISRILEVQPPNQSEMPSIKPLARGISRRYC
jgi:hypothetical protein